MSGANPWNLEHSEIQISVDSEGNAIIEKNEENNQQDLGDDMFEGTAWDIPTLNMTIEIKNNGYVVIKDKVTGKITTRKRFNTI